MADAVTTPVVVDYTSRDFYSLRTDLIARVKENLPKWTGDNPADFGVAMIEAFSYMGDVVNYYIDRVANENYLPTATQRQSLLNIARNYGYTPAGYRAASCTVQFINAAETSVTLPAGTELVAEITTSDTTFDLVWTITSQVVVPALGNATATAYQYEDVSKRTANKAADLNDIDGELVGISDGTPEQAYQLSEDQVVDGSVKVWVQNGTTYEPWTEVVHLTDFGPYDQVFTTLADADNYVTINFGDGVSGAIPNKFAKIKAVYNNGGGSVGNIGTNLITELYRVPNLTPTQVSALSTTLSVTNTTVGIGGAIPEDNADIRVNAPKALTALNRAVSLQDYSALAVQVSGVGKANATAIKPTSVTVYVAPTRTASSVDQFPGYTDNPADGGTELPELIALRSSVSSYFTNRIQIGTTVTVSKPTYVPVTIQLFYTKFEQYDSVALETAITKALLDAFKYSNQGFANVIHPEEIETTIRNIDGIRNARVTLMHRTGSTAERGILIGKPDEIFVALTEGLTVTAFSTNAFLSSVTSTVGTLAPVFSPDFYTYSLPVPNGTTSLVITPSTQSSSAVLRVNGIVKASGSNTTIGVSVGNTTVAIGVVAADGLTSHDYIVTISRAG